METAFTPVSAAIGGVLIGLSAALSWHLLPMRLRQARQPSP